MSRCRIAGVASCLICRRLLSATRKGLGQEPNGILPEPYYCRWCGRPESVEAKRTVDQIRVHLREPLIPDHGVCGKGHPLINENVYVHHGTPRCRACRTLAHQREAASQATASR